MKKYSIIIGLIFVGLALEYNSMFSAWSPFSNIASSATTVADQLKPTQYSNAVSKAIVSITIIVGSGSQDGIKGYSYPVNDSSFISAANKIIMAGKSVTFKYDSNNGSLQCLDSSNAVVAAIKLSGFMITRNTAMAIQVSYAPVQVVPMVVDSNYNYTGSLSLK